MYIPFKYFIIPCLCLNTPIYSSFYLRLDLSFSPNFNHDSPLLSSLNQNFIFSLLSCIFEEPSFSWYYFFCLLWTMFKLQFSTVEMSVTSICVLSLLNSIFFWWTTALCVVHTLPCLPCTEQTDFLMWEHIISQMEVTHLNLFWNYRNHFVPFNAA